MGCGCGGASNVYQPPQNDEKPAAPERPSGAPKVWNGPRPQGK
jgi:hypothetical protein